MTRALAEFAEIAALGLFIAAVWRWAEIATAGFAP
jgi:hypothetical protein